ncbi:helicase and polymerase-containing protein TEBICHI isoform X2 [Nymphaea colorata]|nr:helicase and polymerase-containing protein TEBICHI isoform X2 [Nymphaea colorata]
MDQDPHQMRINEFFVARKNKPESAPEKLGKSVRSANTQLVASPNSKHTLDKYLVNSQAESFVLQQDAAEHLDPIKRSLKLEIDKDLDSSQKLNLYPDNLVKGHDSEAAGTKEMQNGVLPFSVCEEAISGKSASVMECSPNMKTSEAGVIMCEGVNAEISKADMELTHFATNFLSVYCSGISSAVKQLDQYSLTEDTIARSKRNVSPSLLIVNSSTNKKKQCITDKEKSCQIETSSGFTSETDSGCGNDIISQSNEQPVKQCSSCPKEHEGGSSSKNPTMIGTEDFGILRRCSRIPSLTNEMNANPICNFLCNISNAHETSGCPKGTSIFSPGEEFWSEAIQLADDMLAPNDNLLSCVHKGSKTSRERHDLKKLDHLNNTCYEEHSLKNNSNIWHGKPASAKRSFKHVEEHVSMRTCAISEGFVEEKSPLPVRHFDFSNDENDFDRMLLPYDSADTPNSLILKANNALMSKSLHPDSSTGSSQVNMQCKSTHLHLVADPVISNNAGGTSIQVIETEIFADGENKPGKVPSPCSIVLAGKEVNGDPKSIEKCGIDSSPSSAIILADVSAWVPSEVCTIYSRKGITKLYPWQCRLSASRWMVFCRTEILFIVHLQGKSFVAEILMLRQVLSTGKIALLVLPYVSICAEKAEHLESLLRPMNKHVRSFYGSQGGGTLPKDTSIAVCTIEKANSLINKLLEESRLSEVGIIVIDELHMVGDPSRGYLLELMLTKLRYATGEGISEESSGDSSSLSNGGTVRGLQIVGMSATMPNVAAVADWLQAALYQTDFRPVPLEEYIKVQNKIFDRNLNIVRTIQNHANLGGKDPEHVVELCNEIVQEGHSVLIFCSSRKGCETTAQHVSKYLKWFPVDVRGVHSGLQYYSSALEALRKCPSGLDPILEQTLPHGVAYHHAGLTVEEREIIESCYRQGTVRVLTATSTLAAGVNLPARRVIFRQPRIGRDFIDGIRYRQMAGRAGRTGIDSKGESIMICKPDEAKKIVSLLNSSCQPLQSCLSEDKNGMTHAILEVVAAGIVQTANDIHRYVRCTLLSTTKPFQAVVSSAQDSLRWLCCQHFLEWNGETKLYSTTSLGRAAFGSSLAPEESLVVLSDLSRAREGLVLASDLHLVYLVTPINVEVEPDWELYYERFMELSPLDQSVANRIGVTEPFLMRMAHGAHVQTSDRYGGNEKVQRNFCGSNNVMMSDKQILRVSRRFYVALILCKLVQELPVTAVCEAYKVARGMVQGLQENAGRFASMVSTFCERLGWHDMEGLISKFQHRVSFGVQAEIVELTTIPYVKGSRARSLYKAGLRTPLAVAEASIMEIIKALFEAVSWNAQGSELQKIQFGVAKKIKAGARKIVLEQAEQARVAAFSALKSLGVSVPLLAEPLVSSATIDIAEEEAVLLMKFADDSMCNITRSHGSYIVNAVPTVEDNGSGPENNVQLEVQDLRRDLSEQCERLLTDEVALSNHLVVPNSPGGVDSRVRATICNVLLNVEATTDAAALASDKMKDEDFKNAASVYPKSANVVKTADFSIHEGHDALILHGQQEHKDNNRCSFNFDDSKITDRGPVNASTLFGNLDSFLLLWETVGEFYFDIHFSKVSELNCVGPFELHGIAVCWKDSPVYYINFAKDLLPSKELTDKSCDLGKTSDSEQNIARSFAIVLELFQTRWNRISSIMAKTGINKVAWNLKFQIQALQKPGISIKRIGGLNIKHMQWMHDFKLLDNSYFLLSPIVIQDGIDIGIVVWLLWPDEESCSNPNLEKVVKKRLSMEAAAVANRDGRWTNQMQKVAHNGCCRRVAQIRALHFSLWKLLISEGLFNVLYNIENPLVKVIADMELWGIGIDMDSCHQARHVLRRKLRHLEEEACRLAGMKFSLRNTTDVANILYTHLKLPMMEKCNKKKLHPSTDKHCLELLRNEHPIVPVVSEHRTLAKLLSTLGSICSQAKLCVGSQKYKIHGRWLQTSASTGRLSVENPNLQSVEHMVEFKIISTSKDDSSTQYELHQINARQFFIPTQDEWVILAADYSQIELRLMAHFSGDLTLIELLSDPDGDVFLMITAKWTGKLHSIISKKERDQTKRLLYGVLYGMGVHTLAGHLECSVDEATEKVQSFMSAFPRVSSWLSNMVELCHQNGYIETLKGRKRFLAKIKSQNGKEKAKAERQAVNSICQGSAADIIKIAMIKFHSIITEGCLTSDLDESLASHCSMLKGRCHIILQVHDELVLEVDPLFLNDAAVMLQKCMETAASLSVPLHVKLKTGRTWGSLEPFAADHGRGKACT